MKLEDAAEETAVILKLLSHPSRLRILCALSDGEKTVSQIMDECALEQAPASQFLKTLKSDGMISAKRAGQNMIYSLEDFRIHALMKSLQKIFCKTP